MATDWERGYSEGYAAAMRISAGFVVGPSPIPKSVKKLTKKKRKKSKSPYKKAYGDEFKRIQNKYKTKAGKWKKDGFRRCQKAAHAYAKKVTR